MEDFSLRRMGIQISPLVLSVSFLFIFSRTIGVVLVCYSNMFIHVTPLFTWIQPIVLISSTCLNFHQVSNSYSLFELYFISWPFIISFVSWLFLGTAWNFFDYYPRELKSSFLNTLLTIFSSILIGFGRALPDKSSWCYSQWEQMLEFKGVLFQKIVR